MSRRTSLSSTALLLALGAASSAAAQHPSPKQPTTAPATQLDNRPERLDWFRDQGLGLFVHWSIDSELGLIISHSLAGSSHDYASRFYRDLPKTFNPTGFDPDRLARLARLAGFRYMVFTAKHHNGFAMWNTATTDFSITHTPYRADITQKLLSSFRGQGLATGLYFSPDDFHWLFQNGKPIQRLVPQVQPRANPGLMQLDQRQVTELMTRYGPVSVFFFDGEATGLRDLVWRSQPNTVVTRGALETPEQNVPGAPLAGAWEANMTLGTAWGEQPTDDVIKPVDEVVRTLVHVRSRGGNLLLNVSPTAEGTLPVAQEQTIRTLGSWMFLNGEAIYSTRPWVVTNEGDLWFTRSKDGHSLYVIVDGASNTTGWKRGDRRDFVLKTVRSTAATKISVLGQSDELVEYRPEIDARSRAEQKPDGLHISVVRAQRMRDSDVWPLPTVIRLTDVAAAFTPPQVHTLPALREPNGTLQLRGDWSGAAAAPGATFSFEVRDITGEDKQSRLRGWAALPTQPASNPGAYTATFTPQPGRQYEVRSVLAHPLLTLYGEAVPLP